MRGELWEKDRQLRANLSAIEATRGICDEWYEQRERLYNFQFETGVYSRTTQRADTVPTEAREHAEGDGSDQRTIGSATSIVTGRRIGDV